VRRWGGGRRVVVAAAAAAGGGAHGRLRLANSVDSRDACRAGMEEEDDGEVGEGCLGASRGRGGPWTGRRVVRVVAVELVSLTRTGQRGEERARN
jgi:hypothetical protein